MLMNIFCCISERWKTWTYISIYLQERVHVLHSSPSVCDILCPLIKITVANSCRLVDEEQRRVLVPSIRIINSPVAVLIDETRAKLLKQTWLK